MKKKLIVFCGTLVVAAAAVVASLSIGANTAPSLLLLNIEALTDDEGVRGSCGNVSEECIATCSSCGATWKANGADGGPSSNMRGTCSCGASFGD